MGWMIPWIAFPIPLELFRGFYCDIYQRICGIVTCSAVCMGIGIFCLSDYFIILSLLILLFVQSLYCTVDRTLCTQSFPSNTPAVVPFLALSLICTLARSLVYWQILFQSAYEQIPCTVNASKSSFYVNVHSMFKCIFRCVHKYIHAFTYERTYIHTIINYGNTVINQSFISVVNQ